MRKKEITVVIKDENGDLLFTYSEPIELNKRSLENMVWIKKGIWNIKELLNTQPKTEEKPVYVMCMGEEIVAGTDKSIKKHKKDTEDFLKTQSTPEKKKDWEERTKKEFFNKFNWDHLFSKETKGIVWDYVKQLLLDREREAQIEVLTDIFQTCYQEDSKTLELVEEKLSKLTTK